MSALKSVIINGVEYVPIFDNGQIVSIKRFNEKYGTWVVIQFSNKANNAEKELMHLLTEVYVNQIVTREEAS
ncbi:hypothetical protein [Schinkia azotoformans]|uniref:hypothetical protein n=1 Tax=Schinkia azotoformans TaxID=1454 RepID=UPI002DBD3692|nr:hypothetical protein [Schinkia azotoformans]MEC1717803.1 hypothetical protein [Schinkia azotoformans]MEC1743565.1 hypothetical protein [Schinkia azotoformans]MEC1746561.1 hypothetical protein [Schinkia azotoformans]MEC1757795.1 hypothetical protein [Schinkia azotoformans]MEC1769310.1 hypothetical protein [Schinkia azotoformans]